MHPLMERKAIAKGKKKLFLPSFLQEENTLLHDHLISVFQIFSERVKISFTCLTGKGRKSRLAVSLMHNRGKFHHLFCPSI